jgi:hypothetical protein
VWLVVLVAASSAAGGNRDGGDVVKGLQVRLSADRSVVRAGQEIRFSIDLVNEGTKPFRILEPTAFVGEEMVIRPRSGAPVAFEGGYLTWSPKAGTFPGRTILLATGARHTIRWDAYLDSQHRLLFSDDLEARNIDFAAIRAEKKVPADIPDKYVGDGRVFALGGPGTVRIHFRYARSEHDREWRVAAGPSEDSSTDGLWLGEARSNQIQLVVGKAAP